MSKRKTDVIENFGERLAQLRKAAGYTQVEFAAEVGITQRMVAYYEVPNAQPPAHLLPQMAQVLGVGADVLLGMARPRKVYLRKTCSNTTVIAMVPSTHNTCGEIAAPRNLTDDTSLPVK